MRKARAWAALAVVAGAWGCGGDERPADVPRDDSTTYGDGSVVETAACKVGGGTAAVEKPVFLMNVGSDTGWFSSPAIADLSDGTTTTRALVVPSYSIDVYSATGEPLSHVDEGGATSGRIYPPGAGRPGAGARGPARGGGGGGGPRGGGARAGGGGGGVV